MSISRKHLEIYYNFEAKRWEFKVLGKNGCFVNRVVHNPESEPGTLDSGSLLQFGGGARRGRRTTARECPCASCCRGVGRRRRGSGKWCTRGRSLRSRGSPMAYNRLLLPVGSRARLFRRGGGSPSPRGGALPLRRARERPRPCLRRKKASLPPNSGVADAVAQVLRTPWPNSFRAAPLSPWGGRGPLAHSPNYIFKRNRSARQADRPARVDSRLTCAPR